MVLGEPHVSIDRSAGYYNDQIDLSTLKPGVYIVVLIHITGVTVEKVHVVL